MDIHRYRTFAIICILIFTLMTYSTFFSELQLPWRLTPTGYLCSYDYYNNRNVYPYHNTLMQDHTPTSLSHLVFVISGCVQTWHQRRTYTELWWRPNLTRGHVWLDQAPTDSWPDTSPPYRISRNTSLYGEYASASRIAASVVEAYQLVSTSPEKEHVRWFVMGDDDTVFFVDNLVTVLQKYDHKQMYYVGMLSESVEQDISHSYKMAFGGAGFVISYPAAAELARVMDTCLDRYASFYGSDHRVQSCLSELGVPLTYEPGFHQVDVKGDAYGMLAAHPIAPLVSLHHLDSVKPISPNKPDQLESLQSLFSAYQVDPARILQQSFCYESIDRRLGLVMSVSVSWGFMVQVYPRMVAPQELEMPLQTFKTWGTFSDGPFTFNTRSFGEPCLRPFIFVLDRVLQNITWTTITQYARLDGGDTLKGKCNNESLSLTVASRIERVRVFAPKMDPLLWKQAPRRQCCQIRRTKWGRMLEVRIKHCSPYESSVPRFSR